MGEKTQKSNNLMSPEDLLHWVQKATWTLHEATMLSLGRDPKIITEDIYKQHNQSIRRKNAKSPYNVLKEKIIRRLRVDGSLYHVPTALSENKYYIFPLPFVQWAQQFDIGLPEKLIEKVYLYHQERDFRALYEEERTKNDALNAEISVLKEKYLSVPKIKPLHAKEKDTLLKMIAAVMVDAYGYDPMQEKNKSLPDIRNALDSIGHSLDDDTIRDKLKQANQFIRQKASE